MNNAYRSFIANPIAATSIMIFILLAGGYHLLTIEQEIFPDFAPPAIHVEVTARSSTPTQLENSVLIPIERAVRGINGVERVESNAGDRHASVRIILNREVSASDLQGMIKSRIDAIDTFPADLESVTIENEDRRTQIMWLHLVGTPNKPLSELAPIAHTIKQTIESMQGVGKVELSGEPYRELEITVDRSFLQSHRISMADLAEQVATQNIQSDAGALLGTERDFPLTINRQTVDQTRLAAIPITLGDHTNAVPLGDFAIIGDGYTSRASISRLDGNNSIGLAVFRSSNSNPADVANRIHQYARALEKQLPDGLTLVSWLDESRELSSRLRLMTNNGLLGMALVLLTLAFFTHWRVAVWVFAGIPVTYLGAVTLMGLGIGSLSINVITMFGFLIVSGILVDDALIVGESVYQSLQTADTNTDPLTSIEQGVRNVAAPAVFGVITSIAAFFPLTMLDGDLGHSLGAIATVIILCLTVSIFESKCLLPAHLYGMFKQQRYDSVNQNNKLNRTGAAMLAWGQRRYLAALAACLSRPGVVLSSAGAIFVLSIGLVSSGTIKTTMIPEIADFELEAELSVPAGASLDDIAEVTSSIESAMRQARESLQRRYDLPYNPFGHAYTVSKNRSAVSFIMELTPRNDNPISLHEFVDEWRSQLPSLAAGYTFHLSATAEPNEGVNVQLEGADHNTLMEAATELKGVLTSYPGISDVRDNLDSLRQEYEIELTPFAKNAGVLLEQVSNTLRHGLLGLEVHKVQTANGEVSIVLRYPEHQRQSLDELLLSPHLLNADNWVTLGDLINLYPTHKLSALVRVNGKRAVNVFASNDDSILSAEAVMEHLEDGYLETLVSRYPELTYRIEGEARESSETQTSLLVAFALALFSVYALLSFPLRSFALPLLVLSVLPLGIATIVFAHGLFVMTISITSLFGAIALIGVLVNDSLILVHKITAGGRQSLRGLRADLKARIVQSCTDRFRPIVITSLTTFLGVLPIMLETDPEALWLTPIAVSLGVGILSGTFITLLVLPCLIYVLNEANGVE